MAQLAIDQARPGMILSADVLDRRGRLLVPSGSELTERHLSAFRMWGVPAVQIQGEAPPPEEAELPEWVAAEVEAELTDRFRAAGGPHPFLDELRRLAARSLAKTRMAAGAPS